VSRSSKDRGCSSGVSVVAAVTKRGREEKKLVRERSPPLIPAAAISVCLNTRTEANLNNRANKRPRLAPEIQNDSEQVVSSAPVVILSTWS
jgi:hypothetical protein